MPTNQVLYIQFQQCVICVVLCYIYNKNKILMYFHPSDPNTEMVWRLTVVKGNHRALILMKGTNWPDGMKFGNSVGNLLAAWCHKCTLEVFETGFLPVSKEFWPVLLHPTDTHDQSHLRLEKVGQDPPPLKVILCLDKLFSCFMCFLVLFPKIWQN